MRLLFLSNFYPPYELGGFEQWCDEVATRFRERGHVVNILTSRYGKKKGFEQNNFWVRRELFLESDVNYYHALNFFVSRPFQERQNLKIFHDYIDEVSPDLILVWGMWNLSRNLLYYAESWLPGKVVYFIASYWPVDQDPHEKYWKLTTNRKFFEMIKKPLRSLALSLLKKEGYPPALNFEYASCCSSYVRDTLVNAKALPPSSDVIFGGIDPQPFLQNYEEVNEQKDSQMRLLYFGRLIFDKGVHTAVEAMEILKQKGMAHHFNLTILGSGHPDYETHLHQLVDKFELNSFIKFVHQVPRSEIPKYLKQHDVYLFTSIWPEPMARSVMEAMASGLLVIGSEVGGQTEMLINGQNGLTFEPGNAMKLADHLLTIQRDPYLRKSLSQAGKRTILDKFTIDRMVTNLENKLTSIMMNVHSE